LKTHLVIPDGHTKPGTDNRRWSWIGNLILDLKPDVVVSLGDDADMESLCAYDKGTRAFQGRSYGADIDIFLDSRERMMYPLNKAKKKKPRFVYLEGNHDHRIKKALNLSPELDGAISFKDLELDSYYHDVVEYVGNTPGTIEIDGVYYAHYFTSGVMGRPISGEHPAYSLLSKQFVSCTAGHLHTADYCIRTLPNGRRIHGAVAGVFQEHDSDFAGVANKIWWKGVVIKRYVSEGDYAIQFVTMKMLEDAYGD
jgi:hypothetical protein